MAYVNPGELKWQIRLIDPKRKRDENDHYVSNPGKGTLVRAAVRAVRAGDEIEYGAARAQQTLQFIIRYRSGLTTDMNVLWRGHTYEIESIDPTPFAGGYMRIRAVSYDEGVGS